jgi:glycosyltransferase involved in cell wall biosynthesis
MLVITRGLATGVIPAYNEVEHIGSLLKVLHTVPQLKQILVVDDASIDKTADIVLACSHLDDRIQLLRLEQNEGKGGAIMAGVKASKMALNLVFRQISFVR